ncbi:MAG: hypothetical protein Q4D58_08780 [Synergistaceae bacterium]|nr:hypothetical protein [Synergistaceae bacterium]
MSIAGIKTVTATATAVQAGASALSGRTQVVVQNRDDIMSITVGATLSGAKVLGSKLEAGQEKIFNITSGATATIYAQSPGRAVEIGVIES